MTGERPSAGRLGMRTPAPTGGEESAVDWHRLLAAVTRYKWLVLALTMLGAGVGVGASRFMPPLYVAQATLWLESGGGDRGPIRSEQLLQASAWVDLLKSYLVLDDVVRQMRLYLSLGSLADSALFSSFGLAEQFRPGAYRLEVSADRTGWTLVTREGAVLQHGSVGDSIGSSLGFRWVPPLPSLRAGRTSEFRVVPPRDAAASIAEELRVRSDETGNFLWVELKGTRPAHIAGVVNAVTQRHVQVAADLKRQKLTELTRILREQLQSAERNLRNAEISLETFRVQTITLPGERAPVAPGLAETRDPVFGSFFDIKIKREQLRRDREAVQRWIAAPDSSAAGSADVLRVVPSVQQSTELTQALAELNLKQAELRALRYRYTDAHPSVARVASEVAALEQVTLPTLARTLIDQIATQERALEDQIGSASQDLRQIPARAIEEARQRRDVAIAENLYTTLQARYEEARLGEASSIPDVRILDAAVPPESPIRNTARRVLLMGLMAGLGLGLLGAVVLDRLDPRFRYPEQATRDLGLTILGAIPRVRRNNGAHDAAPVVEALRSLRLNLAHAYGAAGPMVVTITSPGAGEGKSFVSSNLALAFADSGQRTLLVDADLRRGALHRVLKVQRKPGLSDYLKGTASFEEIVKPTAQRSLYFLGGGSRMQDAPELLSSGAMVELLTRVRSHFSVILVDSPPLAAGVDPFVLATRTGSLLLVLRTGVTDRELALTKLDNLDRLPIRVLGAVLNDVSPTGVYRYYGYLGGYETAEEDDDEPPEVPRRPPRQIRSASGRA